MNTQTLSRRRQAQAQGESPVNEAQAQESENQETETETVQPVAEPEVNERAPERVLRMARSSTSLKALSGADILKMASSNTTLQEKSKLVEEANSVLDELVEIQKGDEEQKAEAAKLTNSLALSFYDAMVRRVISYQEVTDILGGHFGWSKKGAGGKKIQTFKASEASSTPYGYGDAIRQRVQRAVKADAFVREPETADSFFRDLSPDYVEAELAKVDEGTQSIWNFYDSLTDARKKAREDNGSSGQAELFVNPGKLAKLIGSLTEAGTLDAIAESANPGAVLKCYAYLSEAIAQIFDAIPAHEHGERLLQSIETAPAVEIA